MPILVAIVLLVATVSLPTAGCAEGERGEPAAADEATVPEPPRDRPPKRSTHTDRAGRTALPARLSCPPYSANCAAVRGRIIYVEAVDPDGDGDAHFALASREGVTLPGVTVVDVGVHLRPRPLPKAGDYLSAVGPVYPGSYGQAQIEATEIRVGLRG